MFLIIDVKKYIPRLLRFSVVFGSKIFIEAYVDLSKIKLW